MRLRENASIVVELDGVGERNIAAVHAYRSRDARPEVGFDRAPQRVVHPAKAMTRRRVCPLRKRPRSAQSLRGWNLGIGCGVLVASSEPRGLLRHFSLSSQ